MSANPAWGDLAEQLRNQAQCWDSATCRNPIPVARILIEADRRRRIRQRRQSAMLVIGMILITASWSVGLSREIMSGERDSKLATTPIVVQSRAQPTRDLASPLPLPPGERDSGPDDRLTVDSLGLAPARERKMDRRARMSPVDNERAMLVAIPVDDRGERYRLGLVVPSQQRSVRYDQLHPAQRYAVRRLMGVEEDPRTPIF